MAKNRPSLGTFANPTQSFVAPVQAEKTVAPLNQQAIRDTYAFADAFGELSQSMVKVASAIKTDMNEQQFGAGQKLINETRKSYADLERSGQIKPNENPWFAIGAQQASGIIEAQRSAVELEGIIEQKKKEDPSFLDDTKAFDALVASYASNKSTQFGTAQRLSSSFFDNFNPAVVKLQAKNFDDVENARFSKYINASRAKTDLVISHMTPANYRQSVEDIQASFDEMVANAPSRGGEIGQAFAAQLIDLMRSSGSYAEAKLVLHSLRAGSGPLVNTEFVKSLLIKYGPEIARNEETTPSPEAKKIAEKAQSIALEFQEGKLGAGDAATKQGMARLNNFISDVRFDSSNRESFGNRPDGTPKGNGWLGVKKNSKGDYVTEYSVGVDINGVQMDIPTLVPGLTEEEISKVLKATETQDFPPQSVVEKAVAHAEKMISEGKSVFAAPDSNSVSDNYFKGKASSIDDAAMAARSSLEKMFDAAAREQAAQQARLRNEIAAGTQSTLRSAVRYGDMTPKAALDEFHKTLNKGEYGFTEKEKLEYITSFENDMAKMRKEYEDGLAAIRSRNAEVEMSKGIASSLVSFATDLAVNPQQTVTTPLPVETFGPQVDALLRDAQMTEDQRKQAKDRMYAGARKQVSDGITAVFTKTQANGGMAPFDLKSLEPEVNDSPDVSAWKTQARYARNYALLQLDASMGKEDTVAKFRAVAASQLNSRTMERGVTSDVEDLYRIWAGSKSGFIASGLFNTPEGKKINEMFEAVQAKMVGLTPTSFQDAVVDAVSMYSGTRTSAIEGWTRITDAQSGERQDYTAKVRRLTSNFEVTNPDAMRILEGMYAYEVISEFNGRNKLNLSMSLETAYETVNNNLMAIRGSFLPKVGGIGQGQFTPEHFNGLADFYAGASAEAVFIPIDIDATGNYIFALRDKNGNTLQARLFTMEDLVSREALARSSYYRLQTSKKSDGSERSYLSNKGLEFIDYSFTDEARISRQQRLMGLRSRMQPSTKPGETP